MKNGIYDEMRNLYKRIKDCKEHAREAGIPKKELDKKLKTMKVKLRKLIAKSIECLEIESNRHYYDSGNDNYWELIKYVGKTPEEAEKMFLKKDYIRKPILLCPPGTRYSASYSVHRVLDTTVIFHHVLRTS